MSNMGDQLISNVFKAFEQSNTSQHLTILKNQGIVESIKDGSKVIYSIKSNEVYGMIDFAEAIILQQIEETKTLFAK